MICLDLSNGLGQVIPLWAKRGRSEVGPALSNDSYCSWYTEDEDEKKSIEKTDGPEHRQGMEPFDCVALPE